MLALSLVFAIASGSTAFAAASAREVSYQGPLTPLNIVPTFDKGHVIVYDAGGVIVYAPDGSLAYSVTAHVEGARHANILNASVDADGTLVAAIAYEAIAYDPGKGRRRGGGIASFDRTGAQTRFFDTAEYLPTQVCVGPDHSIWTLGWRWPGNTSKDDYFVLRNYSLAGQEIGAFLPRSSFAPEPDPVGPCTGSWQLRIANGRVGALFYISTALKAEQQLRAMWIETELNGKEAGRWDFDAGRDLFAFTQSGALYGQGHDIAVFDRSTNRWHPVVGMPTGNLLGADGDNLVFYMKDGSAVRRVPVSQ